MKHATLETPRGGVFHLWHLDGSGPTLPPADPPPLHALRHHVTGAIERGEAVAVAEIAACPAPVTEAVAANVTQGELL